MDLERAGFRVISVGDGRSALERAAKDQPALMVLDLMLPVVDGYEVCRQVRAKSELPIIMLTARDEDIDKIIGLELGADDYLTKIKCYSEILSFVQRHLGTSGPLDDGVPTTMWLVGSAGLSAPAQQ